MRKTLCCRIIRLGIILIVRKGLDRASGIGWDAGLGGTRVWWATRDSVNVCLIRPCSPLIFFFLNPITILRAHMIAASALIWGPDVFLQQLINLSYNYNIISKFKLCDFVSNLIIPMFDYLNLPSWNIYVCISLSTTSNKVLYLYLYLFAFRWFWPEKLYA